MANRRKAKGGSKRYLNYLLAGLMLIGMGGASWYLYNREMTNFVTYPEFGIPVPENFSIHGIDVSHHQQAINWDLVEAMQVKKIKIGFAFIKATEGIGRVDSRYNYNWHKAKEKKLRRGAYHFFLATKSGKLQAQNFIDVVTLKKGDLPPVLDVEQTYGVATDKLRKEVKAFLETVENYYGVTPIIYTNVDFYRQYLGSDFDAYPLWAAHYLEQHNPRIDRSWLFWQHSERGRVNGIITNVDFNVFNGDSAAFRKLLIE
jgi:lysozyme